MFPEGTAPETTSISTEGAPAAPPAAMRPQYSSKQFWDARFAKQDKNFDWYTTFEELKVFFVKHDFKRHMKVLMLGCGTSSLSKDMHDAGFFDITNIDVSAVVIEEMQQKHPEMVWLQVDGADMLRRRDFRSRDRSPIVETVR